ncbi:tetratricopeptide repeat protein [Desulfacinum infernum]|uniref:tetratricopeptide repeat protein n=1 Tax=Desulfacinum infernum TaxID=35837 RepID=UPI0015B49559|nr:tetratricopeptide repeat protein [Desulfacinum infernum]
MKRLSRNAVIYCTFLLILLTAYSNTITSPPVLDDFHTFVRNSDVHFEELSKDVLDNVSKSYFGIARLIPMITFGFDYWLGGGSIKIFHMTNIIIHVLSWLSCLWMVYSLSWANSVNRRNPNSDDGFLLFASAVACLWAVHPVQTSSVTYLVQRMASLQAFFFMASCAAFLTARMLLRIGRKSFSSLWFAICGIFGLGAFLSKENSAMLPVILLVIEICFFNPDLPARVYAKAKLCAKRPCFLALYVICAFLVAWVAKSLCVYFAGGYSGRHFTMAERLLTEARVVMDYIVAVIVPNPEFLSLEHDVPISSSLLNPPSTSLCALAILLSLCFAVLFYRRNSIISFGIVWFYLNLIIESTIVPLELKFDHRMYLPSVGLILAIVEAARLLVSKCVKRYSEEEKGKLAWASVAVICSILSLLTFSRNEDWRDIITINQDAVQKAPNNPRAHANYSVALVKAGRYDEAILEAQKAIELGRPGFEDHFVASTTILTAYMQQEEWEQGIEEGRKLLEIQPDKFDATSLPIFYLKLGYCYRILKQYSESYRFIREALEVIKKHPRLSVDKKWVYVELESLLEDIKDVQEDIDGDRFPDPGPLSIEAWIAQRLYELKDFEGATLFARKVPENPTAQRVLRQIALFRERTQEQQRGWSFTRKYLQQPWSVSNLSLGIAYAVRRYDLEPFCPLGQWLLRGLSKRDSSKSDVHLLQGWYAFERGDYEGAVASAKKAIELDPQYAKAWIALGFFAQKKGDVATSLTAFRQTLELYPGYPKRDVLEELMARLEASAVATPEADKEPVQGAA